MPEREEFTMECTAKKDKVTWNHYRQGVRLYFENLDMEQKKHAHINKLAALSVREGFIDSVKKANRKRPTTLRRL